MGVMELLDCLQAQHQWLCVFAVLRMANSVNRSGRRYLPFLGLDISNVLDQWDKQDKYDYQS